MSAAIPPQIQSLYKGMSMDDLDIVEAFEKTGWTLVAVNSNQFRWQSESGGTSNSMTTAEEVADFARDLLPVIQREATAVAPPVIAPLTDEALPDDLASKGWVLHSHFGHWLCTNETASRATSVHAKLKDAFDEAQAIQKKIEAAPGMPPESPDNERESGEDADESQDTADDLPEMPGDLADVGWTFKREGEELYAVHEDLMISTSHDQEDPETVIAEARGMQEDYERQLNGQAKTSVAPEVEIVGRAVVPPSQGQLIEVDLIRLDGGTQMRVEPLDMLKVAEYAELMKAGRQFPAVDVFFDGKSYWLGDGFYRHAATRAAELVEILAIIHPGTQRDAVLFAVGANATHGIPRTNADKRRAVEKLLYDEEWRSWTDARIAEAAGVSDPYVKKVREDLAEMGIKSPNIRIAKDGRKIDTTRIGDREAAAQLSDVQPVLPGAEAAVAEIHSNQPFVDDTRRAADFEMADPTGESELELNAHEEEEARRNFDPVNEANADEARREEQRAEFSELLDALRDKPNGLRVEELVDLGITHEQIEQAARARIIERHPNGRIFYQWTREDVVAAIRKHGPLNRFQLEDELGCQSWVVNMAKGAVIRQTDDGAFTLIEPAEQQAPAQTEAVSESPVEAATPETTAASNDAATVRAQIEENRKDAAAFDPATPSKTVSVQPPAPAEKPKQPSLRSLLKGRDLFLSLTLLSAVKDTVTLSINFERDKYKAKRLSLHDYEIEGLPEPIRTAILRHLEDAPPAAVTSSQSGSKKAAGKKGATKKAPPARPSAGKKSAGAKKPVARAAAKTATKSGTKKSAKSTTKRPGARA